MSHIPYYGQAEKTHKTGYEIRAQMLELAKSYLENMQKANLQYAEKMMELGQIQAEEYTNLLKPYSFEDMMKKAQEFYGFVERK